jgi:hypothetical protein
MPYIPQDQRNEPYIDTPGKVAYAALQAAMDYLRTQPAKNWDTLSNAHKAMVCAEREFYRRHLAPHEDEAIARNGDLY